MNPDATSDRLDCSSAVGVSADRKAIEMGRSFLNKFISSLKTAQLYDINNDVFLEHVRALGDTLREILQVEGEASVEVAARHIFFNGLRLPMDFASYPAYRFLMDGFIKSNVGKVWFEDNLQEDEFKIFLVIFAKSLGNPSKNLGEIEKELKAYGVVKIHLQEPQRKGEDFRKTFTIRKVGKQMYSKSIMLLDNIMVDAKLPQRTQARVARRLVQNIVDSIIDDEAYMLALTNIKNHYDYTLNHSINVSVLSIALGYRLGMSKKELEELGIAALFHDIGKVNVPREILTKPGKLSAEEYEVIKRHPYQGAEILTRIKGFGKLPIRAITVALEHHLGEDFSGYPKISIKKRINLFSKIINITDVFDAMTTHRVYQEIPYKRDEALGKMMEESGKKFDPLLLKAFVSMLGLYPIGSVVILNTGELAVVLETNQDPAYLNFPKVKLITGKSGEKIDGPIIDLASQSVGYAGLNRTIVKSVDADKYGIDVTAYF